MSEITIRTATQEDVAVILDFIHHIAQYENLSDQVKATEETLRESLFVKHAASVLLAQVAGEVIGYAVWFYNFSTFEGKRGLYLEDIFILPQHRTSGIGSKLFAHLAHIALESDCARMEWACLDWNEPSIAFYKKRGAKTMDGWTTYRLEREGIAALLNEAAQ